MQLPLHSATRASGSSRSGGLLHDPAGFSNVFLGAFRRDLLSFYPGCRLDLEPMLTLAGSSASPARTSATLDFQLDENDDSPESVRVSLYGNWYRLSVPGNLRLGPCDRDLIRAIGRVMELHHQILFRRSRISLLQLRRGMPEDHYIAACLGPSAYSAAATSPSRIAEAILTLRTMALSTYENRRVTTGAIIVGPGAGPGPVRLCTTRQRSAQALNFGVELTSLKTVHRLCDGRRTLFLVDHQGKLADVVDIRQWAICQSRESDDQEPTLSVPCPRVYTFHALATRSGGHVCLVLSLNQEIKIFAGGVQAFVFAHGRWRVLDPGSKYARWEKAVGSPRLARVLFQTALDLAEERQGGLLVVVSDPAQAIGRLIAPHDLLDPETSTAGIDDAADGEFPARPLSLFGLNSLPEHSLDESGSLPLPRSPIPPLVEPLAKRSIHYLARGGPVTEFDAAVLESLAGLDGALVTDSTGHLLAFGAILRHDAPSLTSPNPASPPAVVEGARTTAAIVASRFGPVLKISEDGIVSCFLDGARVWDL
ncbi:MAG: hypothetical protein ACP5XB_09345 [Isosphaeraceae bacterium]